LPWFDDFTKAVAGGRPTRSAMLDGLARFAAGAVLSPVVPVGAVIAQSERRTTVLHGPRAVPGKRPRRRRMQPSVVTRGPCTFTDSTTSALDFSASSSSLRLKVHQELLLGAGSPQRGRSRTTRVVMDVTDRGASVMHLEARFNGVNPHLSQISDGALNIRYGSKVRGASSAALTARAGRIEGTLDGRRLQPHAAGGSAASTARFADGKPVALTIEPALRAALSGLVDATKRGLATCRAHPTSHHRSRRPRSTHADASLRTLTRELRPFEVADYVEGYDDGSAGGQNGDPGGAYQTPDCYAATVNLGLTFDGCIAAALVSAIFCPPCAWNAMLACYGAFAGAEFAMNEAGGACNEVPCQGQGFSFPPKSCDHGTICCGQYDCCPSGDICAPQGFCCTPDHPLSCGTNEDDGFCCTADRICGQNNQCLGCPQGQIAQNGQCCNFLCGSDCCQSADATCDHATGRCVYPNFGGASPRPTRRGGIDMCTRTSGLTLCTSPNFDTTTTNICCRPGVNCCAGQCCNPGEQCGGNSAATFRCGRFIR
jgi:hypothetical protein